MDQTRRLYHEEPELRSFTARVLSRRDRNDGLTEVVLDQTGFFPTGGGQPHDLGTLGEARVIDVFEEDGRVVHRLEGSVPGDSVTGTVDWSRRLDHRQQHTGQHILSRAIWDLSGGNTVGFHLGAETCSIDLDSLETVESLDRAETLANRVVFDDSPISDRRYAGPDQVPDTVRKEPAVEGEIRVIAIGDFDATPCCGTHCTRTGQVGPIKILRFERRRGGTRVEFVCGMRAIEDHGKRLQALRESALAFTTEDLKVPERVQALQQEMKLLRNRLEKAERELMEHLIRKWGSQTEPLILIRELDETRVGWLAPLGKSLAAERGAPVFLTAPDGDEARVLLAGPEKDGFDAGAILKPMLAEVQGRGGGTGSMAQGRLPGKMTPRILDKIRDHFEGSRGNPREPEKGTKT